MHTQALRGIVVGERMEVEEAMELVTKEKNINVRTHPRYALCTDSESALLYVVSSLSLCSTKTAGSKQLVSCQLFTRVIYFVPLSSPPLPSLPPTLSSPRSLVL